MEETGGQRYFAYDSCRFKLLTAELKLAAQRDRFPAHFQNDEEGQREVRIEQSPKGHEDEVVEIPLRGNLERTIRISKSVSQDFREKFSELFHEFEDVFAWDHTELKGVDPEVCQHRIPLRMDARPVRMQRYRMNPNYAKKVKEEIDALLKAGFIAEVESSDWLFPIVVVPKKNGKIRVCVDFRKLNEQTIKDPFPLPFADTMLDQIAGAEMYSFADGYSGYNQISLAKEDREKTTFITEWGAFMYLVMPVWIMQCPSNISESHDDNFQRISSEIHGHICG